MRAIASPCLGQTDLLLDDLETGLDPEHRTTASPRLEMLRPIECQLTIRDYTLLEGHLLDIASQPHPRPQLLVRLTRTKLADAQIVLSDDIATDIATGNSRIVYSLNGEAEQTCVLRHWEQEDDDPAAVPVRSLLGVTLLGMRVGQNLPLLRENGSLDHVAVTHIAFQPEAARRAAPA